MWNSYIHSNSDSYNQTRTILNFEDLSLLTCFSLVYNFHIATKCETWTAPGKTTFIEKRRGGEGM